MVDDCALNGRLGAAGCGTMRETIDFFEALTVELDGTRGDRAFCCRTFNIGRATAVQHGAKVKVRARLDAAIGMPGVTTDQVAKLWPAGHELGFPDAARVEKEVVVADRGCEVISLFPVEELPIANRY